MSTLNWPLTLCWFCESWWITASDSAGMPLTNTHTPLFDSSLCCLLCMYSLLYFPPPSFALFFPTQSKVITRQSSLSISHLSFWANSLSSSPSPFLCPVIKTSLSNNYVSHKSILPTLGNISQQMNYLNVDFVDQKLVTWLIYVILKTRGRPLCEYYFEFKSRLFKHT